MVYQEQAEYGGSLGIVVKGVIFNFGTGNLRLTLKTMKNQLDSLIGQDVQVIINFDRTAIGFSGILWSGEENPIGYAVINDKGDFVAFQMEKVIRIDGIQKVIHLDSR